MENGLVGGIEIPENDNFKNSDYDQEESLNKEICSPPIENHYLKSGYSKASNNNSPTKVQTVPINKNQISNERLKTSPDLSNIREKIKKNRLNTTENMS